MPKHFPQCDRIDWYSVNAIELSKFCLARGRYEVANELHELGTEWYERFAKPEPGATREDHQCYRDVLASYKDYFSEFPLLIETRDRLLTALRNHPQGIDRDKLKREVTHKGVTTFGVICNQLERGGWLRQTKAGKKYTLHSERISPASDEVFVKKEIPTREKLEFQAAAARPIATVEIGVKPASRSGCLLRFLCPVIIGLSLLRVTHEGEITAQEPARPPSTDQALDNGKLVCNHTALVAIEIAGGAHALAQPATACPPALMRSQTRTRSARPFLLRRPPPAPPPAVDALPHRP